MSLNLIFRSACSRPAYALFLHRRKIENLYKNIQNGSEGNLEKILGTETSGIFTLGSCGTIRALKMTNDSVFLLQNLVKLN